MRFSNNYLLTPLPPRASARNIWPKIKVFLYSDKGPTFAFKTEGWLTLKRHFYFCKAEFVLVTSSAATPCK
jgi:hypothetical protein